MPPPESAPDPPKAKSAWQLLTGATPSERPALAWAFGQFSCVLMAYYLLRPVRDQFSAAVGSTNLWQFWVGTFVATLLLVPVFGALVARWPREKFVPAVYLFFIACLGVFMVLFGMPERIGTRALGIAFYIWLSVFSLCVVSVFWSFMADVFDGAQSRRLFPVIALGGVLGAIAGPIVAALVPIRILLVVSACLLGVATVCTWRLSAWSRENPRLARAGAARGEAIGGGAFDGLRLVFANPFLRRMAGLLLLGDAIGTIAYSLSADAVGAQTAQLAHAAAGEARKTIYAHLDLATNVLQLVLQVSATRWLMARFGAVGALIADGVLKSVVLLATILVGAPMVIPAMVITRAGSYGLGKPASDSLYARAERIARYKGKNAIDTAGWRFGDVVVSLSMKGLMGVGMGIAGFAAVSGALAALSTWMGWRAAKSPGLEPEVPGDEVIEGR